MTILDDARVANATFTENSGIVDNVLDDFQARAWTWLREHWDTVMFRKWFISVKGKDLAPIWTLVFGREPGRGGGLSSTF